jgi:hypothetical protein
MTTRVRLKRQLVKAIQARYTVDQPDDVQRLSDLYALELPRFRKINKYRKRKK